jgi:hypothetical protein
MKDLLIWLYTWMQFFTHLGEKPDAADAELDETAGTKSVKRSKETRNNRFAGFIVMH